MPSLNALKAFEAAARLASFSRAAAELSVSHAAISRHIRALETWLGLKLFVRTGRGVDLTEHGKAYATEVTRGFDILAGATEAISARRKRRHLLRLTLDPAFAALWLVPRLGRFTAEHPTIEITLDPSERLADFSRNEADLGIRYGRGGWSGVTSQRLAASAITPVCSPSYLKKLKAPVTPESLSAAILIQEETRHWWNEWLKLAGVASNVSARGPTFGSYLSLMAAEAGQGFALADDVIAADAIMAGRLVKPFEAAVTTHAYFLVRAEGSRETSTTGAFRRWLEAEIAETLANVRGQQVGRPKAKAP